MSNIHAALRWKYDNPANLDIRGDEITKWPEGIGPEPDSSTIASIIVEHEVYEATIGVALIKIARLEAEATPRRIREHALGKGGTWLADQDALIATERSKL
jgi:hypothetical protein